MKLIKDKNSEYGNFDLIPEDGWQLRVFTDFTSKLLIVSESLIDLSNVPITFGSKTVPTRRYVTNPELQKILTFEEWRNYFNYEEEIAISEDGKLKEVWQRIHEKKSGNDFYQGKLFEVKTNKVLIDNATSIAFNSEKRRSLIHSYYENIKHREQHLDSLKLGEYPEEIFQNYLEKLTDNLKIFEFYKTDEVFELIFKSDKFFLCENGNHKKTFDTIDDFWAEFSKKDFWEIYSCRVLDPVMQKFIIRSFNYIVKDTNLTFNEFDEIHSWLNLTWNDKLNRNIYWQFCSRCKKRVMYYPRYPKRICGDCSRLEIKDENGYRLGFSNVGMSGGFVVSYYLDDKLIKQTQDEWGKICYIEGVKYIADEAKFGGIVIQKADDE